MATWTVVAGWSQYDSGGMARYEVEADSAEEATRKALGTISTAVDDVLAFPCVAVDMSDVVDAMRADKRAAEEEANRARRVAAERAEFERLRAKFEPTK